MNSLFCSAYVQLLLYLLECIYINLHVFPFLSFWFSPPPTTGGWMVGGQWANSCMELSYLQWLIHSTTPALHLSSWSAFIFTYFVQYLIFALSREDENLCQVFLSLDIAIAYCFIMVSLFPTVWLWCSPDQLLATLQTELWAFEPIWVIKTGGGTY